MRDEGTGGRLWEIASHALDLEPEERTVYLLDACGGDGPLLEKVRRLLADAESSGDFLESGGPSSDLRLSRLPGLGGGPAPRLPETIGGYRILGILGEGGMGTVYEAQQREPHRRVALKILRSWLLPGDTHRWFRREVEILGRLHHPFIAHIYEAGTEEGPGLPSGGIPYLVMELAEGAPTNVWVRESGATPQEILELLVRICEAVHYAHTRGVVHRDLKPANILVAADGSPKILDFGVARILGEDRRTFVTAEGQVVGTLSYMSPEQLSGDSDRIGPRSDVYSLGVLVYEMLSGRTPLPLDGLSVPAAIARLREEDPPSLNSVDRRLGGDVSTIVGKAMEEEPERRYASAAALADDIRRHLEHRPIEARAPSAAYRLRRFTRRNRSLVASVSAVILVLILGSLVAIQQAIEARRGLRAAERAGYRSSLGSAVAYLEADRKDLAQAALLEAPARLRGWEWNHLMTRLESSEMRWKLEGGRPRWAGFSEDGEAAYVRLEEAGGGQRLVRLDLEGGSVERLPFAVEDGALRSPTSDLEILSGWLVFPPGRERLDVQHPGGTTVLRRCGDLSRAARVAALTSDGARSIWIHPPEEEFSGRTRRFSFEVCDSASGEELQSFEAATPRPLAALSPSGARMLTSRGWLVLDVRATASETVLATVGGLADELTVARLPSEDRLLGGSYNGGVRFFELPSGRMLWSRHVHPKGAVGDLAGGGEDLRILSVGTDGTLALLDGESGDTLHLFPTFASSLDRVALEEGAERALALSPDGEARLWNLEEGGGGSTLLGRHGSFVYPVAFHPGGESLASGSWDGTARLWDLAGGRELWRLETQGQPVYALAFHPGGDRLFVGTRLRVLLTVDSRTGEVLRRTKFQPEAQLWKAFQLAMHPEGDSLALCKVVDRTELLDPETLESRATLEGLHGPCAWSPEGEVLLLLDEEDHPVLVDRGSLRRIRRYDPPSRSPSSLAWAPDGRRFAAVTGPGEVTVWGRTVAEPEAVLDVRDERIFALAWSPDGERLAVGGDEGVIHLYETAGLRRLVLLPAHASYIYSLAWDPSGKTLASGSGDGTVRLWRSSPESRFAGHPGH